MPDLFHTAFQPGGDLAPDLQKDELPPLVSIEDIGPNQCRWPIEDTLWCGRLAAGVYCPTHAKRAYVGAKRYAAGPDDKRHFIQKKKYLSVSATIDERD